jgi:hypothetical protein
LNDSDSSNLSDHEGNGERTSGDDFGHSGTKEDTNEDGEHYGDEEISIEMTVRVSQATVMPLWMHLILYTRRQKRMTV